MVRQSLFSPPTHTETHSTFSFDTYQLFFPLETDSIRDASRETAKSGDEERGKRIKSETNCKTI